MTSFLAWFAAGFSVLVGLIAFRKVVGVVRGELVLSRFRDGRIAEEEARDEVLAIRRRYGASDFRWLGALGSIALFCSAFDQWPLPSVDLSSELAGYVTSSFTPIDVRSMELILQILLPFLFAAIPFVEFLDRRQVRVLPDPEDPLEHKRPPFRNLTFLAWLLVCCAAPLWLRLDLSTEQLKIFWAFCVFAFLLGALSIWLLDRRAHYFPMGESDRDGAIIRRIAGEVGTPVHWMAAVADDRTFAKGYFFGFFVVSAQFERTFDRGQREKLIRYELARSHPRFLAWYAALFTAAMSALAISAFTPPWGLVGFVTFVGSALVAFARIEMARLKAGATAIGSEPETQDLVDRYIKLKPSF